MRIAKSPRIPIVCVHCRARLGEQSWDEEERGPAPVELIGHCHLHFSFVWDGSSSWSMCSVTNNRTTACRDTARPIKEE